MKNEKIPIPLQIVVSTEGKWFVAACPLLDIATQGRDEEEVRENMEALIGEYFKDPDTPKPRIETMINTSVTIMNIPIKVEQEYDRKASCII